MRLVSAYLLLWMPMRFAVEVLSTWPSLAMRGAAGMLELAAHGVAAAFSVAASRMLTGGSSAAIAAASIAVVANGIVAIQSLYWTVLPRDTAPGTRFPMAVFWVVVTVVALFLIARHRRLRDLTSPNAARS